MAAVAEEFRMTAHDQVQTRVISLHRNYKYPTCPMGVGSDNGNFPLGLDCQCWGSEE